MNLLHKSANVMIGIASGQSWESDFGMSLAGMVADFSAPLVEFQEQSLQLFKKEGTLLPALRQGIAERALERGCNYLLFADTDQSFPPYTLRRLLSHRKPVVACNIPIKRFPSLPTARAYEEGNSKGRVVFSTKKSPMIERIWRIGTGVMLIDTWVFARLEKPWFPISWRPEFDGHFQGEDWGFCEKLDEAKVPIFVDHALSLDIKHVGKLAYDHGMCLEEEPVCSR